MKSHVLCILDIWVLGQNPGLAASPCNASGKLLLHVVIFDEERKMSEARLRDMKGQWKRLATLLARQDPLFPLNINLLMTACSLLSQFTEKRVSNTVLVTIPNLASKT